ncbi:MAG: hypothetical protein H7336_14885 [Bacteriovorax sp.]|nr:hypothetical protein [Bacteriovorax sp.]
MKALSLLVFFLAANCFADIQIAGLRIIDARIRPLSKKEAIMIGALKTPVRKGDFEGNGGDPLRLRYGIIYNFLRALNVRNVEGVFPPSTIYNYKLVGNSKEVFILRDGIYIPSTLYFEHNTIKKIVDSLFQVQLINVEKFFTTGKEGFFNNPTLVLDNSVSPGGVNDFNQRLSNVFFDMSQFIENASLKKDERVKSLKLLDFQLVDEDVYDHFGSHVCGIHVENFEVKLNTLCWSQMSVIEQRLVVAHEIFRIMNFSDDDYCFTYQFLKFQRYSEVNDFEPFLDIY